jgi:NRAMP (natural resistance-associated macrophage protein)-like metal ion transporter
VKKLGPGLVTGAADDDPSGIATYSQAGARFGFDTLWSVAVTFPLMVAIQMISARIGAVSGKGLATNIRECYPKWLLYPLVVSLCIANVINIGADISAMGAAVQLMLDGPKLVYGVILGAASLLLQIFIPYQRYVHYLKWLTLVLLAYVATVFVERVPWSEVVVRTVAPRLEWNAEYITTIVAILGTTISPYLFFWQASQEVEEQYSHDWNPLKEQAGRVEAGLRRIRLDTVIGMAASNVIAFFIILSAAVTIGADGPRQIEDSVQAAQALRPMAGEAAFFLFSLGIIGTGLLALPVLAGSAAYAVAGTLQWRNGLGLPLRRAKAFYAVIGLVTIGGMALSFSSVDPMQALYWSAVINGVVAAPIMVVMMLLSTRRDVMGAVRLPATLKIAGWLATAVMAAASVAMLYLGAR